MILPAPANDNDRNISAITRGGRVLYVMGFDERAAIVGDMVMITHPDRRPKMISAIDGTYLGEVRA